MPNTKYALHPIGFIRSPLRDREAAPKQGSEGAPDAWLEVTAAVAEGLEGIGVGDDIIVITWFHAARRDILKVHLRGDTHNPLTGVFSVTEARMRLEGFRQHYTEERPHSSPGYRTPIEFKRA